MAEMMGSLTTELRIAGRIMRETLLGFKRTGWMNVIIVLTMASILSIFGIVMAIVLETGALVQHVGSEVQVSVYVQDKQDPLQVQNKIVELPHVRKITLISKEKAWADMQKSYPMPDIQNPLPDTLHVQLTSEQYIPQIVQQIKTFPEVEEVQYAKRVLDKIRSITKGTSVVGMIVSLFLGTLTMFIISNTIHLLIQGKSREIEILRMMGVGNWYIRLPFLFQGAAYGLIGSLVAYIPLYLSIYYVHRFFNYIGFGTSDLTLSFVMTLLIFMGLLVGGGGATVAIRKYLLV